MCVDCGSSVVNTKPKYPQYAFSGYKISRHQKMNLLASSYINKRIIFKVIIWTNTHTFGYATSD